MKKFKNDFLMRIFVQVSIIVAALYAIMNIVIYAIDKKSGAMVTVFFALYLL